MNFKFLKCAIRGLLLSTILLSNVANAGLIVNGNEWLDMSVTGGMSRDFVEQNILTQAQYQDYEYASAVMLNELFKQMVGSNFNAEDSLRSQWNTLNGLSDTQNEIADWFFTVTTDSNIPTSFIDTRFGGIISEVISTTPVGSMHLEGWINIRKLNPTLHIYQVFDRGNTDPANLGTLGGTSYSSDYSEDWMHHALVRKVEVQEPPTEVIAPPTVAILALGLIGLGLRRFKKQS